MEGTLIVKKKSALLLTTTLLAGVIAGCSSTSGNDSNASGTNDSKANAPAAANAADTAANTDKPETTEKATVNFWHSLSGKNAEYMDALIKRFNDSHPNIEVVGTFQGSYDETVTKLQQSIAAGTGPDVTMLERAYIELFADSDTLENLRPMMDASNLSESEFLPGLMGHSTFNDKLVALPLNRSTPILHINKTLLDAKGLSVPKTWDELKQTANALVVKNGKEISQYGLTMPYEHGTRSR